MKAILFGSIGVFCDSSDLQRQAYNQSFAEAGLDWYWDVPLYKSLLLVPGGLARVNRFASEYGAGEVVDAHSIHQRKTELYAHLLHEQQQPVRSGVARLIKDAKSVGTKVGWITTTEQANLEAIMQHSQGVLSASDFDLILHRQIGSDEKPHPSPYFNALKLLKIDADQAVAIEDTAAGMRSATRADIACVVTPHRFSLDQDYYEATAVVSSLGDPGSPATMLGGTSLVDAKGLITLNALRGLTGSALISQA